MTVGAFRSQSPGAGSARSRSVQGREPPDKTRRLTLTQTEEAQGRHCIRDTSNARCKTSSDGKETQGTVSGSTHQLLNCNTQEGQGSGKRCRHHPEQEREAGPKGSPKQDHQGGQLHQGPPLATEAQGETEGLWTTPGLAHGRDLARQRAIDSARPRWQRGINRFDTNPEEEQKFSRTRASKGKSR